MKEVDESYDEENHSNFFHALLSRGEQLRIPKDKLEEYDLNITQYIKHINENRDEKVSIKYFQYLAILFTEIYLDNFFSDPVSFLNELNDFTQNINSNIGFSMKDLKKLAFGMATGSGKTLIFHVNYLQFLKYNRGSNKIDFDNILLITPSEGLSDQHMREMEKSGIPHERFSNEINDYLVQEDSIKVKVIEIHKFTENKTGNGVSVDIESFGNKNVIFVDEGHKGLSGKAWKNFRDKIVKKGFTFEYSATFNQAISNNNSLSKEYSKAIIFDYSFPHFHNDGYGKNYEILNLRNDSYNSQDVLLLGNALSYYEQKLVFDKERQLASEYNIEPPLWIIVGGRVNKQKNALDDSEDISDVLQMVLFLKKLLRNENDWSVKTIDKIMSGKSGILDQADQEIFPSGKFWYIQKHFGYDSNKIYLDMLKRIFHVEGACDLHLIHLKSVSGEIGLRAGTSNKFFGVINIGDTSKFAKHAKEKNIEISSSEFSESLFNKIHRPDSEVNILIGAKKFMEGWNSWRVSTMGLLRVGRNEGVQIIQLFGRGIRLKGKNFSLKRSTEIKEHELPPKSIGILEKLGIFGIKADYMEKFREYLRKEGIEEEKQVEIPLKIKIEDDFLNKRLFIPRVNASNFKNEVLVELKSDENINVTVDLTARAQVLESGERELSQNAQQRQRHYLKKEYIPFLNWERICFQLLDYKIKRGWNNLIFTKEALRKIIENNKYSLYCLEEMINPTAFEELDFIEKKVVIPILKKYIKALYDRERHAWAQKNIYMEQLTEDHENLKFGEYSIQLFSQGRSEEKFVEFVEEIKEIVSQKIDDLWNGTENNTYLKNVHFSRHLYQPLLAKVNSQNIKISPTGLNQGEEKFIEDLKKFLNENSEKLKDKELFVLRNLPRKGVGFYETYGFFPDFIIWLKKNEKQRIIFVEPHGLTHGWSERDKSKEELSDEIKKIEERIQKNNDYKNVFLDSYIISVSPYEEVKGIFENKSREILEEKHILFQKDDPEYISKMLLLEKI
jgi:hypothetical protein